MASKAPKGKAANTDKAAKERANRKRQAETQEETPARPIKIIFHRPVQQEPDPLAAKINIGTQEEEAEEEPLEHVQRRQKASTAEQVGERSDPKKDGTPLPRTEHPAPRMEPEPIRTKPFTELPAQ